MATSPRGFIAPLALVAIIIALGIIGAGVYALTTQREAAAPIIAPGHIDGQRPTAIGYPTGPRSEPSMLTTAESPKGGTQPSSNSPISVNADQTENCGSQTYTNREYGFSIAVPCWFSIDPQGVPEAVVSFKEGRLDSEADHLNIHQFADGTALVVNADRGQIDPNALVGTTSDEIAVTLRKFNSMRNLNLIVAPTKVGGFDAVLVKGFELGGITVEDGIALYFATSNAVLVIVGYDDDINRSVIDTLAKI